jgi:ABC-2 type transport system permease protein
VAVVERIVPAAVRGLIGKDLLVIRRDLRSMSQLISPLILGVIYAVMLVRGGGQAPAGRGEAPLWFMQAMQNVLVYGNVAISLFVGWMLLSRLAMMGFSQEGKSYWLLKSAPVSADKLLAAKFLVAYLPTLVLGCGFLLAISLLQRASLGALLFGLSVVALCFAGAAGVNLAFGVVGVNLEWNDPRQMTRGTTGCLGMLASAGYMLVALTLFFVPPIGFALLGQSETAGQLTGLVLGGIVSLFCAIAPPRLVRDRVPRIGEV